MKNNKKVFFKNRIKYFMEPENDDFLRQLEEEEQFDFDVDENGQEDREDIS